MNVNHNNLWSIGWRMGKSDYFLWLIFKSLHIPNTTIVCTLSKLITGKKRLEKAARLNIAKSYVQNQYKSDTRLIIGFFGYRRDNHTNKNIFYSSKFTRRSS